MRGIVLEPPTAWQRLQASLIAWLLRLYLKLARTLYTFAGLRLLVPRGCFPPNLFSTHALLIESLSRAQGLVADAGTGPGSLGVAVASLRGVEVIATDVCLRCLRAARLNALANGVYDRFHPVACDWLAALRPGSVSVVIANPPYLPVPKHTYSDPVSCGSKLEVYIKMLESCMRALKRGGVLLFTASSLTFRRVAGAKELRRVWTGLDHVIVLLYEKK